MDKNSLIYWVWFSTLQGIGALKRRAILQKFKTPRHIFDMTDEEILMSNELSDKEKSILANKDLSKAERIIEDCAKQNIKIMALGDNDYPNLLKEIPDPPTILYYKGSLDSMENEFPLAMIGARHPSIYGSKMANEFAFKLASDNITIVSGLARGIDALCHKGALKANRHTVAVVGNGLDVYYPPENEQLQKTIETAGAVISEYPPGTKPLKEHFPARNRIICGLSLGVFIVECAIKSGTMITAGCAAEYGRSLYTIPTNLDSVHGQGNLELFKQGAKLVTNAGDIFGDNLYDHIERVDVALERIQNTEPDPETAKIMNTLSPSIPATVDEISRLTGMRPQDINVKLFELEIQDKVCCIAGKRYIKK